MTNTVDNSELIQFVERVENVDERLADEKAARKDVMQEAKSRGYCTKTINKIVKDRKKERDKRLEENGTYETYAAAVGLDI